MHGTLTYRFVRSADQLVAVHGQRLLSIIAGTRLHVSGLARHIGASRGGKDEGDGEGEAAAARQARSVALMV